MTLNELYDRFIASRTPDAKWDCGMLFRNGAKFMQHVSNMQSEEIQWLREALNDKVRMWFVGCLFTHLPLPVPEDLFQPMIRAAVYAEDCSFNNYFIEPCVRTYGRRRVNEALFEFLENGSVFEKNGAVHALYWAQVGNATLCKSAWETERAISGLVDPYDALTDVWLRRDELLRRESEATHDQWLKENIARLLAAR